MSIFQPSDEADLPDDYKGSAGYVVIAVGEGNRYCYLDIDPKFGALRWFTHELGLYNPLDADLAPDLDPGVYKATAKVWASRGWDGNDMGFERTSDWQLLWGPTE